MEHCSNCGAELKPDANFCSDCGAARVNIAPAAEVVESAGAVRSAPVPPPRKIENHLIKSIIATLCCCMPFGVVGIVYAAKVDALLRQGDYAAAEEAGQKAGLWSNLSIGVGLVVNVLTAVLTFLTFYNQMKEGVLP